MSLLPLLLLLLLLTQLSSALSPNSNCSLKDGWLQLNGTCYKWMEQADYWYEAELLCRKFGGNLAAIEGELQNVAVGRVSYCTSSWIGLFAFDARQLNNPGNYDWTSAAVGANFDRHNFSDVSVVHQRLITAADLQWRNNLLHERHAFVCEKRQQQQPPQVDNDATSCAAGWTKLGKFCFHQPAFTATYIEADFYCNGVNAHVTSVTNRAELRLQSLLNLELGGCLTETWVGLVRLTDCRSDFTSTANSSDCYRWSDRLTEFKDFPSWTRGDPSVDRTVRCTSLKGRLLKSLPCHARRHFVCKRPVDVKPQTTAGPGTTGRPHPTDGTTGTPHPTDGTTVRPHPTDRTTVRPEPTGESTVRPEPTDESTVRPQPTDESTVRPEPTSQPQPLKLAAVYDFSRGIHNLMAPWRFNVKLNSVKQSSQFGLRFTGAGGSSGTIDAESGKLTRNIKYLRKWSIFYKIRANSNHHSSVVASISSGSGRVSFSLIEEAASSSSASTTTLSMYSSTGYFFHDSSKPMAGNDANKWTTIAVVFNGRAADFYRNGRNVTQHHSSIARGSFEHDDDFVTLGNSRNSPLPSFDGDLRCFGIAHFAMRIEDLTRAFATYC